MYLERPSECIMYRGEVCAWYVWERWVCACMTSTLKSYSPGVKSCDSSTRHRASQMTMVLRAIETPYVWAGAHGHMLWLHPLIL